MATSLPGCDECGGMVNHTTTCSAHNPANQLVAAGGWCAPSEVIYDIMNSPPPTEQDIARWDAEEKAEHQARVAERLAETAELIGSTFAQRALDCSPDFETEARAVLDHLQPGWDKHMDFDPENDD